MSPKVRGGWIQKKILSQVRRTKDPYVRDYKALKEVVSRQGNRLYDFKEQLRRLKKKSPRLYRETRVGLLCLGSLGAVCLGSSVSCQLRGSPEKTMAINTLFLIFMACVGLFTLKKIKS